MEEMTMDMQRSQIASDSFPQQSEQGPKFPVTELASLDEMINRQPNWTVPVHLKGELEVLLDAAIKLSKEGVDRHSEPCQRFFHEGLVISFTKIMTDESVCRWKDVTQKGILRNAEKLIELVVSKLSQDCLPLLNLLAIVFNPQCKFHTCNATRPSETVPTASTIPDDTLFARPPDPQVTVGWLVDLVNKFGALNGFKILYDRFAIGSQLSLQVIAALMLPFGKCAKVLTPHTVQNYFMPVVNIIMKIPNDVTERTPNKQSKTKANNDALYSVVKSLQQLVCRLPNQEDTMNNLEIFKQRMDSRNMGDQNVKSRHSRGDVAMLLASDKIGENITMDIPWKQLASDTPPQTNKRREKRKLVMQTSNDQELTFPQELLDTLDEKINRPRWVIPILPQEELECLLLAAIRLSKKGIDTHSEPCQRFFCEGLTISFTKLMTDDDISHWKYQTLKYILKNTELLIELVVAKLSQDCFPLLGLLAMVFNPECKFHSCNARRHSETVQADSDLPDDALFARPPNLREPRGWLVDLVNRFGALDGFQILYKRFASGPLSIQVIDALIRPFGQCTDVLTPHTVQKYFIPVMDIVLKFLDGVTFEELKKESKTDNMSEVVSFIITTLKKLISCLPDHVETVKKLEIFRHQITTRLFNIKTNAHNELHNMIVSVPHVHTSQRSQEEEDKKFTSDKVESKVKDKPLSTPSKQTCIELNHNRSQQSPYFTTDSKFTIESKKEKPDVLETAWTCRGFES
ncbi:hypothetical protein CHS0354_034930 [Potamilus streckersoni]|uniref:Uncharacterized protein n=1 Tax=Potamilus streckersoni TaxID=2493646 RepID=A0AAE0SEP7_9BIVA|nr:hypothetical protein CHS0354_034930 [Potamilus streckersoni]